MSPEVANELQEKHPAANPVAPGSLLFGPKLKLSSSFFSDIDEQLIQRAALLTKGSAGPSGMDSDVFRRILCSKNFAYDGLLLREEIAILIQNMMSKSYDPLLLQPLVACRLIPLNKNPGVRPIGVGEVLRRIMGKVVTWACKEEIKEAAGPLQTCAGFKAGAEAAIHAMQSFFDDEGTDAVLLIDARNAFNTMNRKTALVNIQIGCPYIANYIINTYRKAACLILSNGDVILSSEGTTQGDPLAMPWYSVNSNLIITDLRASIPNVKQAWLADDASAAGSIAFIKQWFDKLCVRGSDFGYYVEASKTWLIVKNEETKTYAQNVFNNEIQITVDGQRHLGAVVGSAQFKDDYCNGLVSHWQSIMKKLVEVSESYPQAAYVGFRRGFLSKMMYFFRTIPDFQNYLKDLQTMINNEFVINLFGTNSAFGSDFNDLLSLPTSKGGLGIPDLESDAQYQYASSKKITSIHVESLSSQEHLLREKDGNDKTLDNLIAAVRKDKSDALNTKCTSVTANLTPDMLALHKQNNDKGASHWLNAIPLFEQGFNLSKTEFRDALRLRYSIPLSGLPSFCVCGEKFDEVHALSCKKGGFINQRHDNIRNLFTALLNKVCTNVSSEPHLTPLSGEHLRYLTANRRNDARLDIKARGFWRRGQDAYFDIRVTHVNAKTNSNLPTAKVFEKQEQEKKRAYNERVIEIEHGTFTPLVMGTNGGAGKECTVFVKQLCFALSEKQNEHYNSTINWLRTKLSFEILKSSLLCVRGTRRPWHKTFLAGEDFFLQSYEAGLQNHN